MKPQRIFRAAVFTAFLFVPFLTPGEHVRGLYGTGLRDDWSPKGAIYGDWEGHYSLTDPDGNYVGPKILRVNTGPYSGGYSFPIGAYSGQLSAPVGVWTFRTTFEMENLNTDKATLRGYWRTIRHGAMLLNGQPVAHYTSDGWFDGMLPFTIANGFVAGTNTLEFTVTNVDSGLLLQVEGLQGIALPAGPGWRGISELRDTGILPGVGLAPVRSVDPAYKVVSDSDGASAPLIVRFGSVPAGPHAQWIAPNYDLEQFYAFGIHPYRISFDLSGLLPATARLDGWVATETEGEVQLNGVTVRSLPSFGGLLNYFTVTNGFRAGVNHLDFRVSNPNQDGFSHPAGIYVEGLNGSAQIDPDFPRLSIRVSEVELVWDSAPNVTYQVQHRSSVTGNQWADYGDPLPGVDGLLRVNVPVLAEQGFYRLVTLP